MTGGPHPLADLDRGSKPTGRGGGGFKSAVTPASPDLKASTLTTGPTHMTMMMMITKGFISVLKDAQKCAKKQTTTTN